MSKGHLPGAHQRTQATGRGAPLTLSTAAQSRQAVTSWQSRSHSGTGEAAVPDGGGDQR